MNYKTIYKIILVMLICVFPIIINGQFTSEHRFILFGGSTIVYENEMYKNFGDSRNIYRYDLKTGEQKVILTSLYGLIDVKTSPNGNHVAAIQYGVRQRNVGKQLDGSDVYYPVNNLIVIDTNGKELFKIDDDVRIYDWSPDGNRIVYVVGYYREGGIGFSPVATYIFNLSNNIKYKINEGSININWAEFDNSIYSVGNGKEWSIVYKYDPITREEIKTNYKGIDFSANGLYYYVLGDEGVGFRLYSSSTNQEITDTIKNILRPSEKDFDPEGNWYPGVVRWFSSFEIIFTKGDKNLIYNIKNKLFSKFTNNLLFVKDNKFVIIDKGKIKIRSFEK